MSTPSGFPTDAQARFEYFKDLLPPDAIVALEAGGSWDERDFSAEDGDSWVEWDDEDGRPYVTSVVQNIEVDEGAIWVVAAMWDGSEWDYDNRMDVTDPAFIAWESLTFNFEASRRTWLDYYRQVANTGEEPLGDCTIPRTYKGKRTYQVKARLVRADQPIELLFNFAYPSRDVLTWPAGSYWLLETFEGPTGYHSYGYLAPLDLSEYLSLSHVRGHFVGLGGEGVRIPEHLRFTIADGAGEPETWDVSDLDRPDHDRITFQVTIEVDLPRERYVEELKTFARDTVTQLEHELEATK